MSEKRSLSPCSECTKLGGRVAGLEATLKYRGKRISELKASHAGLLDEVSRLSKENKWLKDAVKEVYATLGPTTECSSNGCQGCEVEMDLAMTAAIEALDKVGMGSWWKNLYLLPGTSTTTKGSSSGEKKPHRSS